MFQKQFAAIYVVIALIAGFVGGALSNVVFKAQPVSAQTSNQKDIYADNITAKKLTIVNSENDVMAQLSVVNNAGKLEMYTSPSKYDSAREIFIIRYSNHIRYRGFDIFNSDSDSARGLFAQLHP